MGYRIKTEDLKGLIKRAIGAVSKRSTLPILSNIYIAIEGNVMTVMATDLDNFWREKYIGDEPCECQFRFTVSANAFHNLLSSITDEYVTLDLNDNEVVVKTNKAQYRLLSIDPIDYPQWPSSTKEVFSFAIDSAEIAEAFKRIGFCAAKDDLRAYLTGIYWHIVDKDKIRFVASDAHRLGVYTTDIEPINMPDYIGSNKDAENLVHGFIIPSSAFKLLRNMEGKIKVVYSHAEGGSAPVVFHVNNCSLLVRPIDMQYPDYERVVPTFDDNDIAIHVVKKDFVKALGRLKVFSDDMTNTVILYGKDGAAHLFASHPDSGEALERDVGTMDGDKIIVVGMNHEFLRQSLAAIPHDMATLHFNSNNDDSVAYRRSFVITPYAETVTDTYKPRLFFIIMPIYIGKAEGRIKYIDGLLEGKDPKEIQHYLEEDENEEGDDE